MSGHSKWANIKHKKARSDEKRGKEFTKIAKDITIAVRTGGGGDPESNSKLKLAIQKAKAINMPNENISRAVKKGTGQGESDTLEEIIYEGYGPGGVAIMLEIASDNRNRTASEIRHLFSKHGGNLGETGCVSWMFKRVGLISIDRQQLPGDEEEFLLHALELGVEDVRDEGDYLEVVTSPETFMDIRDALEEEEIPMEQVDIVLLPENTVDINTEELAAKVIKLIELLEDHDDVQNAYSNASIPDEILEKMA